MSNDFSVVYVLTNPAMPGLVKIGRTSQGETGIRMNQLYSTGVPVPFELKFACRVTNSDEVETALHTAFGPQRINPRREFFRIEPEQAIAILKLLHSEDATAEIASLPTGIDEQSLSAGEMMRTRRPALDFTEMGVPLGASLFCAATNTEVKVTGPKKVNLDGAELSLTAANRQVFRLEYSIQPTPHWTYQGRNLRDIYDDTYGVTSDD